MDCATTLALQYVGGLFLSEEATTCFFCGGRKSEVVQLWTFALSVGSREATCCIQILLRRVFNCFRPLFHIYSIGHTNLGTPPYIVTKWWTLDPSLRDCNSITKRKRSPVRHVVPVSSLGHRVRRIFFFQASKGNKGYPCGHKVRDVLTCS